MCLYQMLSMSAKLSNHSSKSYPAPSELQENGCVASALKVNLSKKPLTRVSKPARPRKEGLGEGFAEKVDRGLAKGWLMVGKGLAGFLAPSNFAIPEAPV